MKCVQMPMKIIFIVTRSSIKPLKLFSAVVAGSFEEESTRDSTVSGSKKHMKEKVFSKTSVVLPIIFESNHFPFPYGMIIFRKERIRINLCEISGL